MVKQWRKYIWSDECSVECSKGAGAKWISSEVVKKALADALKEIWNGIPESLLESLYTSMPRRVAAVIKTEG